MCSTESRWEKPGGFQGASPASVPPPVTNFGFKWFPSVSKVCRASVNGAFLQSSSDHPWAEAVSPEGHTYYYNSETGGEERSVSAVWM